MSKDEKNTLERIRIAAENEFLNRGFRQASLRNIVKTAGVTTGAFYGYYSSKEELFSDLVDASYRYLIDTYQRALNYFAQLPPEQQPEQMGKISGNCMREMLLYMFEHRNSFRLLLQCADGTRYAAMIDELVELEVESTHQYYTVLEKLGHTVVYIDERLEHILVTGLMNAYFEIILHDMSMDDAKRYLNELNDFYLAGWKKLWSSNAL